MRDLLIAIGVNLLVGAVTALLIYFSSQRRQAGLADPGEALNLFRAQFPDSVPRNITLTSDGRNALIDLSDGSAVGLLQGYGRRWNARVLHDGDVASVQANEATLRLKLTDYGSPRAALLLTDPNERSQWLARLQSLVRGPETSPSHA
ncbi:MAG TPA: hypothetical protein VHB68_20385 [Steroidobacteraceae bacterium]|nr:hypothetical protein [Steroidobacteraceae bacterium]